MRNEHTSRVTKINANLKWHLTKTKDKIDKEEADHEPDEKMT